MADRVIENRPTYARLPGGQHGLDPELVSADQRARLEAAMVAVAAETGYVDTTVEAVLTRAGVSRRTFYEHFGNKLDCFTAAADAVLADWMRQGALAFRAAQEASARVGLREQLRDGLLALFGRVLSDPLGARVLFIEALNAGEVGLTRLTQAIDELEGLITASQPGHAGSRELPDAMVKVFLGGVMELVTVRLRHDRTDELLGLAEPLLDWALSYRSADATLTVTRARDKLASAAPVPGATGESSDRGDLSGRPLWRDDSARPVSLVDARARIVQAAAQLASERGYGTLSTAEIVRAARVSHHTFRKHFATKTDAFIAAYRDGSRETIAYSLKAFSAEPDWPSAVRAGLHAELVFLASRPELARLGFLEVYAAGPEALQLREHELHLFTTALDPGFGEANHPPHPIVSEAIAGGIYQLMRDFVLRNPPEQLPVLTPEVTYAALAPFLGAATAAVVAAKSTA